jgi:predicted O-methyltransferase YrrM
MPIDLKTFNVDDEIVAFERAPADLPYFPEWGFASLVERHISMLAVVAYAASDRTSRSKPLNVLEIGSWVGASLLTWAHGIKSYNDGRGSIVAIDPLEPFRDMTDKSTHLFARVMDQLLQRDLPYRVFRHNCAFAGIDGGVSHIRTSNREIGALLRDESFDIVYVDGEHSYQGVCVDLETAMRVVRVGGFVCGDDLEIQAHQLPDGVLAATRDELDAIAPDTGSSYHPGVTAAIAERLGPIASESGFRTVRRMPDHFQSISFDVLGHSMPPHLPDRLKPYFESQLQQRTDSFSAKQAQGTSALNDG